MLNSKYHVNEIKVIDNLKLQEQYDPVLLYEEIKKGNHLDLKVDEGITPIHLAALYNLDSILTLGINKGFVNIKDDEHNTPLHYAAMGHAYSSIKLLVTNGADVDAVDDQQRRPLSYILASNNGEEALDTIKILLDASKAPGNSVAQALMGSAKDYSDPSKLTAEQKFLINYQRMLKDKNVNPKAHIQSQHSSSSLNSSSSIPLHHQVAESPSITIKQPIKLEEQSLKDKSNQIKSNLQFKS